MMKRTFFFLPVLAILAVLLVPSFALAVNYFISSEADMINLVNSVNGGNSHYGDTFELTANISLGDWNPIGSNGINRTFNGTFYAGLFCQIGPYGTVKNLRVKASVSGIYLAGGIAGMNEGNIANCSFEGSVDSPEYSGGLAGYSFGSISNSFNKGSVSANRAGGITSEVWEGTIYNCYNAGTVNGANVGGLASYCYNSSLNRFFWLDTSCPNAIGQTYNSPVMQNFERFHSDGTLYAPVLGQTTLLGALSADESMWATYDNGYTYPAFKTIAAPITVLDFGSAELGYDEPSPQTVTIVNAGENPVTLSALPGSLNFMLGPLSATNLPSGASATFTAQPKAGLPIGTYIEALTISDSYGSAINIYVSFTVTAYRITTVSVEGITAPVVGALPFTIGGLTMGSSEYTALSIVWQGPSGDAEFVNSRFRASYPYTAVITLQASAGFAFAPGMGPQLVNDVYEGFVNYDGVEGNLLAFQIYFPATEALAVTGLEIINQPSLLSYVEGQALNLTGLEVMLTHNDTTTVAAGPDQFAANGITADPENGSTLTMAHNGQRVLLTSGGITANTNALTVIPATYTISASPSPIDFGSKVFGYASAPDAQTVTILNTGNSPVTLTQPTGTDFVLGALSSTINAGASATFTVQPKAGLDAGTYSETYVISTDHSTSATVNVTFTVDDAIFTIEASPSAIDLGSMVEGGSMPPVSGPVTIKNTGNTDATLNMPLGTYFNIYLIDTLMLSPAGEAQFAFLPKPGLAAGSYSETITFSTTDGASANVLVTFMVEEATYTVEADKDSLDFGSMVEGYAYAPMSQLVCITNTGNTTVTLDTPLSTSYTIMHLSPRTIKPDRHVCYLVKPKSGLASGTYDETITFSTNHETRVSVDVSFTVEAQSFAVTGSPATLDFGSVIVGYASAPDAQTITVTNTGNKHVTLSQPSAVHYTAGTLNTLELAPSEAATFTLAPKDGLSVGSYTETIDIQGSNGAEASVEARFTVTPVPTYEISASPASLSFGSLAEGYIQPSASVVTVTNTGNQGIALYQPGAAHHVVGPISKDFLAPNDTATFFLKPKPGLSVGTYNETVYILGSMGVHAQVEVTFACTVPVDDYEVTSGDGGTYQQNGSGPSTLSFTASGNINQFTGLTINGQLVDEDDYDVYEGSTIIVLHQDFLATLLPGTYTLRFHYTDGHTQASFVVQDTMPVTGDNGALYVFGTLILLCLAALWLIKRKRPLCNR